jgi:hypothetical protein
MPVVTLQVPEGVYTAEMKKEIVAKITDAVIEVEGVPQLRPHVTVLRRVRHHRGHPGRHPGYRRRWPGADCGEYTYSGYRRGAWARSGGQITRRAPSCH